MVIKNVHCMLTNSKENNISFIYDCDATFVTGCCQSLPPEEGPSTCDLGRVQSDFVVF